MFDHGTGVIASVCSFVSSSLPLESLRRRLSYQGREQFLWTILAQSEFYFFFTVSSSLDSLTLERDVGFGTSVQRSDFAERVVFSFPKSAFPYFVRMPRATIRNCSRNHACAGS